jgi:hypothetical protein
VPSSTARLEEVFVSSRSRIASVAFSVGAFAAPLLGQGSQYIAPGALGAPLVDRHEALESAVSSARWRWGAVRVEPWLALRELAWIESESADGSSDGDLTATAGAGLHGYLPLGGHATLAAQVLPEYVWWRERSGERRLAGRYGLGLFADTRRFTLETIARSADADLFATPELDRRVELDERRFELRLDVPVVGRFGLFARGEAASAEVSESAEAHDPGDPPLDPSEPVDALDRDERWWAAGVRWTPRRDLTLAAGVGRSRTRFDRPDGEDNEGSSLYGELRWRRPKLEASLQGHEVDLEAADGSAFPGFRGTVGEARLRWSPRDRFAWALYGRRGLVYSIEADRSHFVDRRWGTEVSFRPGWRTSLALFVERGDHAYAATAALAGRTDDVESEGARAELAFGRGFALALSLRRTRVESPEPGREREFAELRGGLTFGAGAPGVF